MVDVDRYGFQSKWNYSVSSFVSFLGIMQLINNQQSGVTDGDIEKP